jgi:hypothetical protein
MANDRFVVTERPAGTGQKRTFDLTDRMRTSRDYRKAIEIVRAEISAWDPYALLAGGAPVDEFDAEVSEIVAGLAGTRTAGELASLVANVFRASFDDSSFDVATCSDVASRIMRALDERSIVDHGE